MKNFYYTVLMYTIRVTNCSDSDIKKHVELLRNGQSVQQDFFEQPFSVADVGQILIGRYEVFAGEYSLEGNLLSSAPDQEPPFVVPEDQLPQPQPQPEPDPESDPEHDDELPVAEPDPDSQLPVSDITGL